MNKWLAVTSRKLASLLRLKVSTFPCLGGSQNCSITVKPRESDNRVLTYYSITLRASRSNPSLSLSSALPFRCRSIPAPMLTTNWTVCSDWKSIVSVCNHNLLTSSDLCLNCSFTTSSVTFIVWHLDTNWCGIVVFNDSLCSFIGCNQCSKTLCIESPNIICRNVST